MKIITITLNPAFDIHYEMKDFKLYEQNYVDSVLVSAGGKGINISRALLRNKIDSTAYIILGKENAPSFVSQLETEGLNFKGIYCEGRIRENITIHTPCSLETRICRDDFYLSNKVLDQLFAELRQVVGEDTILTFSGRIPKGVSLDYMIYLLKELKNRHCLLVVDCNSFSMEAIMSIKPWLIKPNEQEIQELFGKHINTTEQAIEVAVKTHEKGIENVIISMGEKGAVGAFDGIVCIAEVPHIIPLSTIGAGDSLIAGFIGAYVKGFSYEECFINAISFGTAACLAKGTDPPEPEYVEIIKQSIKHRVLPGVCQSR